MAVASLLPFPEPSSVPARSLGASRLRLQISALSLTSLCRWGSPEADTEKSGYRVSRRGLAAGGLAFLGGRLGQHTSVCARPAVLSGASPFSLWCLLFRICKKGTLVIAVLASGRRAGD